MVATWSVAASSEYYHRQTQYYVNGTEPAGRWYAPGGDLGLIDNQEVEPVLFGRLLQGLDSAGKNLVTRKGGKLERSAAFDFTFSAPRSVSMLWAFAEGDTKQQLESAQETAVRAALGVLEREATFARRGKNGARIEGVPLNSAVFRHGESRPAEHVDGRIFCDPNLHHHAVCISLSTRPSDSSIGGLHSVILRNSKMLAGVVYHASLAHELHKLGYSIEVTGHNGIFDVKGVPESAIRYFSARNAEIENELSKLGTTSSASVALAAATAKRTRKPKNNRDNTVREVIWADAAKSNGIDVQQIMRCSHVTQIDRATGERLLSERLAALPYAATEHASVVDRAELLRRVTEAVVGTGLPVERAATELERLLKDGTFLEIGRDGLDRPRFSTPEIIKIEREIVTLTTLLAKRGGFAVDSDKMESLCKKAKLSAEQTQAVLAATGNGSLAVIAGAPGSGKTTSLNPICRGYDGRCLGTASAWRTAKANKDDLSIPSRALASWLASARLGGEFLKRGDVLIVDEAGLVNARDLHQLLSEVERVGAKAILVGDSNQLQAIGNPGVALVQRAIESARVETIVRQHDQWMRDAIYAFGRGHADEALQAFADRGHVVEAKGSVAAVEAIVERWCAARAGRSDSDLILLARTNADVMAISRSVREVLRATNEIDGPEVEFPTVTPSGQTTSITLARGDRVRFLTRNDSLAVINGSIGTVLKVSQVSNGKSRDTATVRIEAEVDGRRVVFSPADLADSKGRARLGWAYASSVYSSQGMTVDEAIVWVDPGFDKHQIYVSASRARVKTTLVVDRTAIDRHISADLPLDQQSRDYESSPEERRAWLATRLSRSTARETTLDILGGAHEVQRTEAHPDVTQTRQDEHGSPTEQRRHPREMSLD